MFLYEIQQITKCLCGVDLRLKLTALVEQFFVKKRGQDLFYVFLVRTVHDLFVFFVSAINAMYPWRLYSNEFNKCFQILETLIGSSLSFKISVTNGELRQGKVLLCILLKNIKLNKKFIVH